MDNLEKEFRHQHKTIGEPEANLPRTTNKLGDLEVQIYALLGKRGSVSSPMASLRVWMVEVCTIVQCPGERPAAFYHQARAIPLIP